MPTYSYRCIECDEVQDIFTSIANRDKDQECWQCGQVAKRNWQGEGVLPLAMKNSFADGHVPAKRKGMMREAAEAMRLKSQAYEMKPEDRGDINREIGKINHASQTTHKDKDV